MLPRPWVVVSALLLLAMGLPACESLPDPFGPPPNVPTLAPAIVTATLPPTQATEVPTTNDVPTATIPAPVPATGPTAAPEVVTLTPVAVVSTATPPGGGTCSYRATFLGDVTIPDNTIIPAGSSFIKTWRIRNDGTCTWGTAGFALHSLVFVGGTPMGAPNPVALPAGTFGRGSIVDISVPMVAPTTQGTYRSSWMLQVDNGPRVGVGPRGNIPLYVQIFSRGAATPVVLTPLQFTPGATNASVQGSLEAGQTVNYSVSAQAGQTMMLTLASASPSMSLAVSGAQGQNPQVVRVAPDGTFWLGLLPVTQDYVLRVNAGNAAANYTLLVTIPQRIIFTTGTIAAVTTGTTTGRRKVTFLLKASAGQTLSAALSAPPNSAGLTIYGLNDGIPLVRAINGATTWTGQLPATQDYVIEVVPAVDDTINFGIKTIVQ